jgi:hypothetical protein
MKDYNREAKMITSSIDGVEGQHAEVYVQSGGDLVPLKAVAIKVNRMPQIEQQPNSKWLIQISLPEINDENRDILVNTKVISCAADTSSGWSTYAFLEAVFIGAIDQTVKFGASIIRQSIELR